MNDKPSKNLLITIIWSTFDIFFWFQLSDHFCYTKFSIQNVTCLGNIVVSTPDWQSRVPSSISGLGNKLFVLWALWPSSFADETLLVEMRWITQIFVSILGYLSLRSTSDSIAQNGIFARKPIPKSCRFGPIEGRERSLLSLDDVIDDDELSLVILDNDGQIMKLDVSDEEISNWMRFVRPAERYSEQNLILHQDEHGQLYFTATRTINPRQELKVWYSPDYAQARGLQLLSPGPMDLGEYQIFWGVFTASNAQRSLAWRIILVISWICKERRRPMKWRKNLWPRLFTMSKRRIISFRYKCCVFGSLPLRFIHCYR